MMRAVYFTLLISPVLSDLYQSLRHFEFIHKNDVSHNVVKRGADRSVNKFSHIREVSLKALGQKFSLLLSPQKDLFSGNFEVILSINNHDIAIAMSPSRADPVLPWLGVFKCLYQGHCTVWGYLNI